MDNRNSTDKKLNFGDIHELLRQANEAPAPSWYKSAEESKPKKERCKKRVTPHAEPIPEITRGEKNKAESEVPKFGIEDEAKEANDFPSQDVAKAIPKAKAVPKAANVKVPSKPRSAAKAPAPLTCRISQIVCPPYGMLRQLPRLVSSPSRRCG